MAITNADPLQRTSAPNKLAKTAQALERYPTWVRSWAIGRVVRFTGTAGVRYEVMTSERVVVSLANAARVRNHIGQIHAAAMALLVETATGMVVGMNVPDDKLPLIKSMNIKYVRRSQGAMRAEATLGAGEIARMHQDAKGEVVVPVRVTDESGEAPITCEMCWAWIAKKPRT